MDFQMERIMNKIININEIKTIEPKIGNLWEQHYLYEKYAETIPNFATYDGVFKCIKIDTVEQLDFLLEQLNDIPSARIPLYRGQNNVHWLLLSSLEREMLKRGEKTEREKLATKIYNAIIETNNLGFEPLGNDLENKLNVFSIGQNFGLNTPLLSFSRSFEIALFFAFQGECDNGYRTVYRIFEDLITHIESSDKILSPEKDFWGRFRAQQTVFSWWGLEETVRKMADEIDLIFRDNDKEQEQFKAIVATKFYISDNLRDYVLGYLKGQKISQNTLFPDFYSSITNIVNQTDFSEKHSVEIKNDIPVSYKPTVKNRMEIKNEWGIYGNGDINVFFGMYYGQDNKKVSSLCDLGIIKSVNLLSMDEFNAVKQSKNDYTKWFTDKISDADCFIVALRKGTQNLQWVKYEIREAWNMGIPVLGIQIDKLAKNGNRNEISPFHQYEYVDHRFGEFSPPILAISEKIGNGQEAIEYVRTHLKEMIYWAENYRKDKPLIVEKDKNATKWFGL